MTLFTTLLTTLLLGFFPCHESRSLKPVTAEMLKAGRVKFTGSHSYEYHADEDRYTSTIYLIAEMPRTLFATKSEVTQVLATYDHLCPDDITYRVQVLMSEEGKLDDADIVFKWKSEMNPACSGETCLDMQMAKETWLDILLGVVKLKPRVLKAVMVGGVVGFAMMFLIMNFC